MGFDEIGKSPMVVEAPTEVEAALKLKLHPSPDYLIVFSVGVFFTSSNLVSLLCLSFWNVLRSLCVF